MNKYKLYLNATLNEIAIDKEALTRLFNIQMDFVPIRAIKTLDFIRKFKISKYIYLIFGIFFFLLYPFIAFIQMIIEYMSKCKLPKNIQGFKDIALHSHHNLIPLIEKNNLAQNTIFIDIKNNNNCKQQNHLHISQILTSIDFLLAYVYSLRSLVYLFIKLENKTDILQGYTSYKWFLVYIGLQKIEHKINIVYFSNHYDRWSVMYDDLFKSKNLIHIQHGILPTKLTLPYKLSNINCIYILNKESATIYDTLFNNTHVNYIQASTSLNLTDINTDKFTILIIGQPHCIDKEIEIINAIDKKFFIYIKPHPLHSSQKYKILSNVYIIEDKKIFPHVNLALCYESTLGLEYQSLCVDVLWWKDMDIKDILREISYRSNLHDK